MLNLTTVKSSIGSTFSWQMTDSWQNTCFWNCYFHIYLPISFCCWCFKIHLVRHWGRRNTWKYHTKCVWWWEEDSCPQVQLMFWSLMNSIKGFVCPLHPSLGFSSSSVHLSNIIFSLPGSSGYMKYSEKEGFLVQKDDSFFSLKSYKLRAFHGSHKSHMHTLSDLILLSSSSISSIHSCRISLFSFFLNKQISVMEMWAENFT